MTPSSSLLTTEAIPAPVVRSTSEWRRAVRYLRKDVKVIVGCLILALLIATALLTPFLAPYDPNAQEFDLLLAPSWQHPLGTDEFGRDLLSRLMAGARVSLVVGFAAVSLAVLASVPLGLIAGYYGGWIDTVIMRYIDLQWAFPSLIIAVGLMAILGSGLGNVIIAVSLAYIDDFARIARGEVLALREEEFIVAARASGGDVGPLRLAHKNGLVHAVFGAWCTGDREWVENEEGPSLFRLATTRWRDVWASVSGGSTCPLIWPPVPAGKG